MKIKIDQDKSLTETEIHIKCALINEQIEKVISEISLIGSKIVGYIDTEAFFIPIGEILYFETVDSKSFFYTKEKYYRYKSTLTTLEERLENTCFQRVSKSVIVNLKKLTSIKRAGNSKLIATLVTNEKIVISRKYVSEIKRKLEV